MLESCKCEKNVELFYTPRFLLGFLTETPFAAAFPALPQAALSSAPYPSIVFSVSLIWMISAVVRLEGSLALCGVVETSRRISCPSGYKGFCICKSLPSLDPRAFLRAFAVIMLSFL
jgi:hypothetical protein